MKKYLIIIIVSIIGQTISAQNDSISISITNISKVDSFFQEKFNEETLDYDGYTSIVNAYSIKKRQFKNIIFQSNDNNYKIIAYDVNFVIRGDCYWKRKVFDNKINKTISNELKDYLKIHRKEFEFVKFSKFLLINIHSLELIEINKSYSIRLVNI